MKWLSATSNGIVDCRQRTAWNADAVILNIQRYLTARVAGADGDMPTIRREFNGILQQVDENLLDSIWVDAKMHIIQSLMNDADIFVGSILIHTDQCS